MHNFFSLLKVQFRELFDFRSSKQKKKNSVSYVIYLILFSFLIFFSCSSYSLSAYFLSLESQQPENFTNYLIVLIGISSLFTVFSSVYQIKSLLYSSQDYDFLSSLPIKRSTIVGSKLAVIYIFEFFTTILILLVAFLLYGIQNPFFFFLVLPLFITIPLFPILLASLLAFFIAFIENKISFALSWMKTLFSTLLVLFIVGISFFISFSSANTEDMALLENSNIQIIMMLYPLLYLIRYGFLEMNFLYLLLYIFIGIVFFLLTFLLVSKSYHNFQSKRKISIHYAKKEKAMKVKSSSQLKTFLKKDFKTFFSSSTILISAIMGPITSVGLVFLFSYMLKEIISEYEMFLFLFPLLICFMNSLAPYTAFALSLEGKYFWILKTSPVNTKKYFASKIIVNELFVGIGSLISSVFAIFFLSITNVYFLLILLIFPQIFGFISSVVGLIMNLCFPHIEWTDERMAIKNSGSVFFTMFIDSTLCIILSVPCFLLYTLVNALCSFLVTIILSILLLVIAIVILHCFGEKRFNKIEC